MLTYRFNPDIAQIKETTNKNEIEFQIKIVKKSPYIKYMKYVKDFFDGNDIHTGVMFYFCKNHEYRIIVREDYYNDLILMLMKHHLLQQVEWEK